MDIDQILKGKRIESYNIITPTYEEERTIRLKENEQIYLWKADDCNYYISHMIEGKEITRELASTKYIGQINFLDIHDPIKDKINKLKYLISVEKSEEEKEELYPILDTLERYKKKTIERIKKDLLKLEKEIENDINEDRDPIFFDEKKYHKDLIKKDTLKWLIENK